MPLSLLIKKAASDALSSLTEAAVSDAAFISNEDGGIRCRFHL